MHQVGHRLGLDHTGLQNLFIYLGFATSSVVDGQKLPPQKLIPFLLCKEYLITEAGPSGRVV